MIRRLIKNNLITILSGSHAKYQSTRGQDLSEALRVSLRNYKTLPAHVFKKQKNVGAP